MEARMGRLGLVVAVLALVVTAGRASAQVCVRLDESRDTLTPEDRRAATIAMSQVIAKNGETVVPEGECTTGYTFYHVKLGNTISVYLYGPQGTREARAGKLDDLPLVYEQMVNSLRSGQPMGTGGDTVDRNNVTTEQTAPRRVASDNVKYVRLGYGGVFGGGSLAGGPAFGIGWRHELDRLAIDISALNLIVATDSNDRDAGISGSWIQLAVLFFSQPIANSTPYFGGGFSWGAGAIFDDGMGFGGTGLQAQLIVGYEMLRASTIRLFAQADAGLPLYRASSGDSHRWVPTLAFSLGVGWGKSNTIAVVAR
jgi:hypothetical protein